MENCWRRSLRDTSHTKRMEIFLNDSTRVQSNVWRRYSYICSLEMDFYLMIHRIIRIQYIYRVLYFLKAYGYSVLYTIGYAFVGVGTECLATIQPKCPNPNVHSSQKREPWTRRMTTRRRCIKKILGGIEKNTFDCIVLVDYFFNSFVIYYTNKTFAFFFFRQDKVFFYRYSKK